VSNLQAGAIGFFIAGAIALVIFLLRRHEAARKLEEATGASERLLGEARKQSEAIRRDAELQAKDELLQARTELEREGREQHRDLQEFEKRLASQEASLERRVETVEGRVKEMEQRDAAVRERERQAEETRQALARATEENRIALERAAGMTREEAKSTLLNEMMAETKHEAAKRIRLVEEEARLEADRRAKRVVAIAIERLAGEFVAERTISVITLPTDDMKGRIIGREGRNIRAIEAATGVDLIVDDTPEAVVISCHNPIRREIARVALEKLISDGRIHPGRIEEVVRKSEHEVEEAIREAGQKALFEVGVHGVHPELIKLLGMLKYRYAKQARRAALLHDIGKSLTHEVDGSHALIGADIARKYGESAKICNAIAAHHEEVKAETILAPLVDAADALSGARPGARREVLESYVRRLEDLERISNSFSGVEKSFAVQAGREIRILVEPTKVDDDQAVVLARDVARKIENEMTYPGQIKVTVIREMRASELAR